MIRMFPPSDTSPVLGYHRVCVSRGNLLQLHRVIIMDVLGKQLSVMPDVGDPAPPQLVTSNARPVEPMFRPEQVLNPVINDQVFRGEAIDATQGPVELCMLVTNATALANVTLSNRANNLYSTANSLSGARLIVYLGLD
jgi:hypothetical protein